MQAESTEKNPLNKQKSDNEVNFSKIYTNLIRWLLHLACLFTIVFLTIYSMAVCPFLDTLPPFQIALGLGYVGIFHIIIRELFLRFYVFKPNINFKRRYYLAILITWFIAGIAASMLHYVLYEDFPLASHLKVLVGYWALGGGFAAIVESFYFNARVRKHDKTNVYQTSFSLQFLVLFSIFMLVPGIVLVLMTFRFAYEGYIDRGAGYEITFLVGVFAAFAVGVGYYYGHGLRDDTKNLINALNKIEGGNYNITIDESRGDELGFVAKHVNVMAKGMVLKQKVENAFGRFVNPKLSQKFIDDLQDNSNYDKKGKLQKLTIVMCDIRDFTKISEKMPPSSVVDMLNNYFSQVVKVIDENNGVIDKFIGDAVLAVFGLTETESDHEIDALKAAVAIRQNLDKINLYNKQNGYPMIDNGIGIHTGDVLAGYLGSKDRLEFTIIGANVNLVSRIQGLAKDELPRILLSEDLAESLIKKGQKISFVTQTELKGFSTKTKLYSPT